MDSVFVSHVRAYAGPGVVDELLRCGYRVVAHDRTFEDHGLRATYGEREGVTTMAAQTPEEIAAALADMGSVTRFVFNDAHANDPKAFERIDVTELRDAHAALVEFPFRLCQLVVPGLKEARTGAMQVLLAAAYARLTAGHRSLRPSTCAWNLRLVYWPPGISCW